MARTVYFTEEIWESAIEGTPGWLIAAALNSVDEGVFFRELFDDGSDDIGVVIFESTDVCERVENAYHRIRSEITFWRLDRVEDLVTGDQENDPQIVILSYYGDLFEVTATVDGKFAVNWLTGRKYSIGVGMTEEEVRDFLF